MNRPPRSPAFTLIEMIMVIALIAILAALIWGITTLVKKQAARGRAKAEINTLIVALENYKADYGGYPQDPSRTDGLDARDIQASLGTGVGSQYAMSSLYLYECLSGDTTTMGH